MNIMTGINIIISSSFIMHKFKYIHALHCLPRSSFSQGKFIRINFDASGYIAGANIETCILSVLWKSAAGVNSFVTRLILSAVHKKFTA